jgi:uncharacterized membrane protein
MTQAFGINDRGQIVGFYIGPPPFFAHGFVLDKSGFTTIDFPGGANTFRTEARGINNPGQIVGTYIIGSPTQFHTFVLDKGIFTTADVPAQLTRKSGGSTMLG